LLTFSNPNTKASKDTSKQQSLW